VLPQALHEREKIAAPDRIEHMLSLVGAQQDREKALQERYGSLMADHMELSNALSKIAQ